MSFKNVSRPANWRLTVGLPGKVSAVVVLLSVAASTPPGYAADPYRSFAAQLAADRAYLEQYTKAGGAPAPVRQSQLTVDPASGEPVINYDAYVELHPATGAPVAVMDATVVDSGAPPMAYANPGGGVCGDCGGFAGPAFESGPWLGDPYGADSTCWRPRLWAKATYLLWWLEGFSTPPLITTSPAGTALGNAGVLGEPTTTILAGGGRMAGDLRSGGRVAVGCWFDPGETLGLEGNYFILASDVDGRSAASAGGGADPFLGRPFFNVEAGFEGPDAELIAIPGVFAGSVQVRAESSLYGVEALFRRALARNGRYRVDLLAGWRFAHLDDELVIRDFRRSLDLASGLAVGTTIEEIDSFAATNCFNGAELGLATRARRDRWSLETVLKLALGGTGSEVVVDGRTTTTVPLPGGGSDVNVVHAGLLAQQIDNIGVYRQSEFAVVSELGMMLGFDLTEHWTARFGYTFLYWSRVARPGDQIDADLNLTQLDPGGLVGNPRPQFHWVFDDVWAQGLNFALECHF